MKYFNSILMLFAVTLCGINTASAISVNDGYTREYLKSRSLLRSGNAQNRLTSSGGKQRVLGTAKVDFKSYRVSQSSGTAGQTIGIIVKVSNGGCTAPPCPGDGQYIMDIGGLCPPFCYLRKL
jgi:hypothetical protein